MKVSGEHVLHQSPERVWEALLDPAVLVRTIPGCERLVATGENAYDMTVTAGVAAIRGTYDGTCRLHSLEPPSSLVMNLRGAGAPGTIDAAVRVAFAATDDGATTVSFDADATVGGMVGGVGQRMLASVSRRMAGEFFTNVDTVLTGGSATEAPPVPEPAVAAGGPAAQPAVGQVFAAPPRPGLLAVTSPADLVKGIGLGAALVALGVVLGSALPRRR